MLRRQLKQKYWENHCILETKEGFTRMVTFKQDVGERVKYVSISRDALQTKEKQVQHSELIKDPFRQVLEKSHDKVNISTKQQIISDNYTVTCTQNSITHNMYTEFCM